MRQTESTDRRAYARRFQAAARALDSAAHVVRMMRQVDRARRSGQRGAVIVGGNRLRVARRVGLLASSMNPLTCAHVALAEAAKVGARLDALCWVATIVTIDKEHVERATLADRLVEAQMYARAAHDMLLLLPGGLYVEQARAAHALLAADVEIVLIVGFDKVAQIFDPRYYTDRDAALHELFTEAELAVAPRAGASEDDLRALLARPENQAFAERVRYFPLAARYVADSSTEARALAASGDYGESLRALLAPEGLALASTAHPYEPARPPGRDDLGDDYSARQTLLKELRGATPQQLGDAPDLAQLVAWSAEQTARGAALRAWATAGTQVFAGLRAALAAS